MDSLLFIFGSAFVVGLSGAMMPGPMLTATVADVLKYGMKAGPMIVAGHALLECALITGILLGMDQWLQHTWVKTMLGFWGGGLLLMMGLRMMISAKAAVQEAQVVRQQAARQPRQPLWTGVLTSLANPYWTIWWATVGLHYLSYSLQSGKAGIVAFYSGHVMSDLLWYGLVSVAVARGADFLKPALHQRAIQLCGLLLLMLGCSFIRYPFTLISVT